jgi:hypothetical protein
MRLSVLRSRLSKEVILAARFRLSDAADSEYMARRRVASEKILGGLVRANGYGFCRGEKLRARPLTANDN